MTVISEAWLAGTLTLDTRARCVARPCCRKRALWALPKLYNTTFSTAPRMLSRASDSITVWQARNPALRDWGGYGVREGEGFSSQRSQGPLVGSEVMEMLDQAIPAR